MIAGDDETTADADREPLVVRSRMTRGAVTFYVVVAALGVATAFLSRDTGGKLIGLVITLMFAAMANATRRTSLTCTAAGATAKTLMRTRFVPWRLVERIEIADWMIIGARQTDGAWVPLLHYRAFGDPDTDRVAGTVQAYFDRFRDDSLSATDQPRRAPDRAASRAVAIVVGVAASIGVIAIRKWDLLVFAVCYPLIFGSINRRMARAELPSKFRPAPRTPR